MENISTEVFYSLEAALKNPEAVSRLDLHYKNLTEFPKKYLSSKISKNVYL